MRVLIVTSIFPPDIGGPATYVPMIARALQDRGHTVTVVTGSDSENLNLDDQYPFQIVKWVRDGSRMSRFVRIVKAVYPAARRADLVFATVNLMPEVALAARLSRKPLVLKVVADGAEEVALRRGWYSLRFEDFQARRLSLRVELLKRVRTWYVRQARRIITPSRYIASVVEQWGIPSGRITVVPNAVEPALQKDGIPAPLKCSVRLIAVGRLVPVKHVDGIIAALPALDDVGLVVVGDGPSRDGLESLASESGVADRVFFAGTQTAGATIGLMADSDVMVLNSWHEGFPHVVVEAMQSGVPVVATAVGGTPEIVRNGENGLLVPPGDTDALVVAIQRISADAELRKRLAATARADVESRFSLDSVVAKTESVLVWAAGERVQL